jgi:prepilin-type processing-associated H-X9-DG protein
LLVVIAIIALLMAVLLPALNRARVQAKRIVCLNGLKQLTLGWMTYADGNNDKLVNGSPQVEDPLPPPGCPPTDTYCKAMAPTAAQDHWHTNELAWIGQYGNTTSTCGRNVAVESGALWKYVHDYKIYHCPTGNKGETITYSIVDGVNGREEGRGTVPAELWKKYLGQIKKSAKQIVFVDEGHITADSFAVRYGPGGGSAPLWGTLGNWFDGPDARHGDGTTLSFADGHAEYWKWCLDTANYGRLVEASLPNPAPYDYPLSAPVAAPDAAFQDLYRMTLGCWGQIAFVAGGHTPKVE